MSALRDFGGRGVHSGLSALGGFRKFILRGNVVDIAVGIVIGVAFTAVVTALVKDLITPLIGFFGSIDFSKLQFTIGKSTLLVGDFINAVISFLILAFVVYFFVIRPVNALTDRFKPNEVPKTPTSRECPFCLSTVPLKSTRCAFCTAQLPPAEVPTDQTPAASA
jgi:large conductance mechanosensitive channel